MLAISRPCIVANMVSPFMGAPLAECTVSGGCQVSYRLKVVGYYVSLWPHIPVIVTDAPVGMALKQTGLEH